LPDHHDGASAAAFCRVCCVTAMPVTLQSGGVQRRMQQLRRCGRRAAPLKTGTPPGRHWHRRHAVAATGSGTPMQFSLSIIAAHGASCGRLSLARTTVVLHALTSGTAAAALPTAVTGVHVQGVDGMLVVLVFNRMSDSDATSPCRRGSLLPRTHRHTDTLTGVTQRWREMCLGGLDSDHQAV
jgi:hypothetical protein